jgi:outer membrane protein assembly factor BamB
MTTIRDIGDLERIGNHVASGAAAFAVADGTATDPTAVTLTVEHPDGTTAVYGWPSAAANGTLTREATGRFYFDVALSASGKWSYKLVGTGAVVAAAEGYLRVKRSLIG